MLKTKSGFEFEPNERLGDDYRFIKGLKKLGSADPDERLVAVDDLVNVVLGSDQAEKLFKHVAEEDGFVSTTKITEEMKEIITLSGEYNKSVKN